MDNLITISSIEKQIRPSYQRKQTWLSKKDVGLPPQAYFAFLMHIDDDYLSEWEVMKFRCMFRTNWNLSYSMPAALFGVFWLAFPKLFGIFNVRQQYHRSFRLATTLANTGCAYVLLNSFPFPNKQFQEVITQPEPNGQYVRKMMKEHMPRHWSMISKTLADQGYNFREMNEYHERTVMPDASNKFDNTFY